MHLVLLLQPDPPSFDKLVRNVDAGLFRSIYSNPDHVIRHYFTDKNLQVKICVLGSTVLLSLLKTPGTLFLGPFMESC